MERISSKKRIIMMGALAVLIAIALVIKSGGGAASRMAEQMLARQNVVAGTLTYEKINAGFAGDVEIRNLVWKAPNGDVKMEMPLATASVNFFDALRKGAGVGAVTNIVFNRPKFYGVYEEGQGLDLLNLLKLAGQENAQEVGKKPEQPDNPTSFRGLIEVKDGELDLVSNGKKVRLDKINSQMAFKQYPLLRASATGNKEKCDLVLNMDYENGSARVTGEAKNAPVPDVMAIYPDMKHIKVTDGVVPTVKIAASKDRGGWHIRLDGKPRNMAGEFFGLPFTDGEGTFTADRDMAELQTIQANVKGMPVTLQGTIKSGRGTPLPPVFDLTFSANNFKTQALSKGLYLDDASVIFSGKVTGTAVEPKIEGTFSCNYLYAAPLQMNSLQGNYVWDAGKLVLHKAEAMSAGAKVALDGFLIPAAGDYQFSLVGNNLDAAQMTDNRITGVLRMKAEVTGTDRADSAAGSGAFALENGRYYHTEGNLRSEEVRYMEGSIVILNGQFGTKDAVMKLGRNKYSIAVVAGDKDAAEIRIGKKLSSSLF
ncbi:MAG: hypothetical protein IJQ91_05530 [Acidaminococcaceae bacterium]|nr:hypothetical protein [Acidaminococcaceae bacterium]